jgi:sugar lactone lactonase YvrE
MSNITCVLEARAEIGECPIWDDDSERLYWIDGPRRQINRFDPTTGRNESWEAPDVVGSFALRRTGGLVVALKNGFHLWDETTLVWTPLATPPEEPNENRFNDGRADPAGRFWAGTMSDRRRLPSAGLYRLDRDFSCRRQVGDIIMSNGLCWSPDGQTMYHADTFRRTMWRYRFEAESGSISDRQVFYEAPDGAGVPDGAVTDREGFVWLAMWGGWSVLRIDPAGRVERKIEMPVAQPTCPCFGGSDFRTLYVTSACFGLDEAALEAQPSAGGLFALEMDVQGMESSRFFGC